MRFWSASGLILLLILAIACTPSQPAVGSAGALAPDEAGSASLEEVGPTEPTPTAPTEIPLETKATQPRAAAVVPPTQTATPPPPDMCSPLALHPLEELEQIIGDPYNPPRPGREERHHGVDFAYYHYQDRDSMLGEPVQSIFPGVVASVLNDLFPYGNMVMIETSLDALPAGLSSRLAPLEPGLDESLYVLYAHMNEAPQVSLGDSAEACQALGEVGLSGNTDIPHLHVEMHLGPAGSVFESMRYYDTRATIEELETYELWRTSGVYRHFDPMLLLTP